MNKNKTDKTAKKEEPQENFNLETENRYLVAAFKQSKYYTPQMGDKELKESYKKYLKRS